MAPILVGRVDDLGRVGGVGRAVGVDPRSLLSAARVTVVAGKGGVGKTTVTAVLACAAASAGRRTVVVELDGKATLSGLVGNIPCVHVSAPAALEEYLREHGFGRIARRLASSGVIDVVSTAAPGIDDIVVLGRIKQLERSGEWDTIVVDGPAAGHAVTMLTSASGLHDAVSGGPVRTQADEVLDMLRDPTRCQVSLVTLPETTPVNETVETAFALEDRIGVHLAALVVNAVDFSAPEFAGSAGEDGARRTAGLGDDVRDAAEFSRERRRVQSAAIERLSTSLALAQLHVPRITSGRLDPGAVAELADRLLTS